MKIVITRVLICNIYNQPLELYLTFMGKSRTRGDRYRFSLNYVTGMKARLREDKNYSEYQMSLFLQCYSH